MIRHLASLLVFTGACTVAMAGFSEMGERLPADTNSVVAINMDSVMQSPLAQKEDWLSRWSSMYEAGPLSIPPGTQRVLSGSHLLHDLERAQWQISMMEMSQQVPMQDIARNAGGTTENMWGKTAVASPNGAYFVGLESNLLASVRGADRQFAVKWIRNKPTGPNSQFIKSLVQSFGAKTQIVLGLDVEDQYSAQEIRAALEANPFKASGDQQVDVEVLSQMLASIQNIAVQVEVTDVPQTLVNLQFGMNVTLMESYAKPLMVEILSRNGFAMPEINDWQVQVEGNRVKLQGELQRNSLRNVLGFITGPTPPYAEARATEASDDPAVIGKASQAYYRSISAIVDSYSGAGAGYSDAAGWLRKEAQRIDRLPVLNVDPELAAWGSSVGAKFREAAAMLKGEQQSAVAGVQGVSTNYGGGYYGGGYGYSGYGYYDGGYYTSNQSANVQARREASRERSRVTAEKKQEAIGKTSDMLSGLVAERAQLRQKMTEKYKIPF